MPSLHTFYYICPALHPSLLISFSLLRPPPRSPLFPYTTLFRSSATDPTQNHEAYRQGHLPGAVYVSMTRKRLRAGGPVGKLDRKSTRLNSSHVSISYAVFCLKKKKKQKSSTHNNKEITD